LASQYSLQRAVFKPRPSKILDNDFHEGYTCTLKFSFTDETDF
jgi:hypothetical protein